MKKLLALLLVAVMAFSLAACTAQEEAPASQADSTPADTAQAEDGAMEIEPAELTYWYWADNAEYSALMQELVANFNETNEYGITVTAEEYPWDNGGFTQSTFTAVMGGGGPDISTFKLSAAKMFNANALLADMSEYVANWEEASQISDSAWSIMTDATADGATRVLPWTLEALYVYYRPSYFEQAGIESVPETWDDFMTAIEKATMDTDGDGTIDVYGYGMRGAGGGHEHLGSFLYANGASWDDLTTPEAVAAYEQYLSIFENGYAPEASVNVAFAEMVDGFKTGTTATIIHHIGSSTDWVEAFGDDVDAFPIPASDDGQWTCAGDTDMVIYEQCENKAAAFEFYKYMTTGQGGTDWFIASGKGLGTENILATEEFASNRFQAVAAESLQFANVLPTTDTLSEYTGTVWAAANQQALLGQVTPEEALAQMQAALHGE